MYNGTAIATGSGSIWTGGSGGTVYYNGGNVGIGTASPAALLDVNGSIISRAQIPSIAFLGDIDGAKWTAKLGGYNLSFGSDSGSFTGFENATMYGRTYQYGVQMTSTGGINTKGSVGIGTANPSTTLHVNGMTYIQGPTVSTTTTNVIGNFGLRIVQLTSTQPIVGQIVGQMCFHGWGRPYASSFIRCITDNSNGWDDAGALAFGVSAGGLGAVEAMRISSTANVGIGKTNPDYTLDVAGIGCFRTGVISSKFTTPSITNGSYAEYTVSDLGVNPAIGVYYVTAVTSGYGGYFAHATFYNWNPALQSLNSIFANGLTFSIGGGQKLRITNTTGTTYQVIISIVCVS